MELTEKTMQVLKNYATINPNIVITEGNVIKTVSEAKNVLSSVELDVTFPQTFGIYELSEFLSVLSLVDSPRLKFEDTYVLVTDNAGRSRIKYFYSDIDMLTTPSKDIIMPETEVKFTLDSATLSSIKRAASVLGHTEMSVTASDGVVSLSVIDNNDRTSNVYSIDVDGVFAEEKFNFIFNISNLKMVDGDYEVGISKKLISHFVNKENGIEYWCALEKSSTYGE
jgi:hypothetical protein|tara:strand:- start:1687 stop:2361 length:675 start_codon:yes stop_codon:yes gene_type:complete